MDDKNNNVRILKYVPIIFQNDGRRCSTFFGDNKDLATFLLYRYFIAQPNVYI